jgi:hypothetical protein
MLSTGSSLLLSSATGVPVSLCITKDYVGAGMTLVVQGVPVNISAGFGKKTAVGKDCVQVCYA